jgi:hypothetical protein
MNAPDLRAGPPPRWNVAVEGVIWLPRLAAKVRAHDAGTLGSYLLGQSPIDDEFLRAARLTYGDLIGMVRATGDDAELLALIEAQRTGARERLRAWSQEVQVRLGVFMRVLDFDDGYERPAWLEPVHRTITPLADSFVDVLRKLRPLKV